MKDVSYAIFQVAPSKNINPAIVEQHFLWRKTGKFDLGNTVQAGEMLEPIWWNRPLMSDTVCKLENDSLYSYNFPYLYGRDDFKTKYNILVNKNSVPVIIQLRIDKAWTSDDIKKLNLLPVMATRDALLKLGVDKTKLQLCRNDLLYNGKKFMGSEELLKDGWYASASVITMNYSEEAEIFKRLTGKYALARGITGIIEETGLFTKEQFIQALFDSIKEILNQLP